MADYYSLLKIRRDATQDEVKRAYRRLARAPPVGPLDLVLRRVTADLEQGVIVRH